MKRILSIFLVFCLLSCGKNQTTSPNEPSRQNPQNSQNEPRIVNGGKPDQSCPWNLASTKTATNYKTIGINLQIDCNLLAPETDSSYVYKQSDLDQVLTALDRSFDSIKGAAYKPAVIRFGKRAFHDSKSNLLQIKLGDSFSLPDIPHHIEAELQLMELEKSEFGSQVRFSFNRIKKVKSVSGDRIDLGASLMFAPPQSTITADIEMIKKFKSQILDFSGTYPDVELYHGNHFFSFELDQWNGSYKFSSDDSEEMNSQFFSYLKNHFALVANYAPVEISVPVYRARKGNYAPDFTKAQFVIEVGFGIRDLVKEKPVMEVRLIGDGGRDLYTVNEKMSIELVGDRLIISGIYNDLGEPFDLPTIRKCIEGLDFSKSFSISCPNETF